MREEHEKKVKELSFREENPISKNEAYEMRKEFEQAMVAENEKQRLLEILGQTSSEDEEAQLEIGATFKKYVSEKRFGDSDKHLTFKDYYKLNFVNDVPEIVSEVLCYLTGYYYFRTGFIRRATYVKMMNA